MEMYLLAFSAVQFPTVPSLGMDDWSLGSGSPSEICTLRTADKYDLMV